VAIRKNKKRIDPRYFLNETTHRDWIEEENWRGYTSKESRTLYEIFEEQFETQILQEGWVGDVIVFWKKFKPCIKGVYPKIAEMTKDWEPVDFAKNLPSLGPEVAGAVAECLIPLIDEMGDVGKSFVNENNIKKLLEIFWMHAIVALLSMAAGTVSGGASLAAEVAGEALVGLPAFLMDMGVAILTGNVFTPNEAGKREFGSMPLHHFARTAVNKASKFLMHGKGRPFLEIAVDSTYENLLGIDYFRELVSGDTQDFPPEPGDDIELPAPEAATAHSRIGS